MTFVIIAVTGFGLGILVGLLTAVLLVKLLEG